jgi:hypothetical protein
MSIVRSFSVHEDGNRLLLVYGWEAEGRRWGGKGKGRNYQGYTGGHGRG